MNKKYTDEQIEFLRNNVKGTPYKKLTEMFNKEFKTDISVERIVGISKHYKLRNGINPRFKKGCSNSTGGFKKNNIPHNTRVLYSERTNKNGYVEIKVGQPNVWKSKQVYVWEKVNNREIPENHVVIFLDGNNQNFNIDNLKLIHKKELISLNRKRMLTKDRKINECCLSFVRLENKIREIEKNVCDRL